MHVGEQVLYLLLIENLAIGGHLAAPEANDLSDTLIVGGESALGQVLLLEDAFQPRPLLSMARVGFVALVAVAVVDAPTGCLLWIESKLCVGLAHFGVATEPQREQGDETAQDDRQPPVLKTASSLSFHNASQRLHTPDDQSYAIPMRSTPTYNNRAATMSIAVKRVYEKPTTADGTRVLVDRLWPRGLTKKEARLDAWLKELPP